MHTLHTSVDISDLLVLLFSKKIHEGFFGFIFCSLLESGTNPCAENNGGCSHLCLAYPGGRTCRCTQGYIAVNDVECIPGLQCPSGSKPCRDQYKCLSTTRFCDQILDCQDDSDEEGCHSKENEVLVSTTGRSCNSEFCSGQGRCMMQKGKAVCECLQGYSGQFCQDKASSSIPVVLTVLFVCLVIVAAAVLKWRYVISMLIWLLFLDVVADWSECWCDSSLSFFAEDGNQEEASRLIRKLSWRTWRTRRNTKHVLKTFQMNSTTQWWR